MPGLRGEAGGEEWEEWGVLGVQQLPDGVSVYVADGADLIAATVEISNLKKGVYGSV